MVVLGPVGQRYTTRQGVAAHPRQEPVCARSSWAGVLLRLVDSEEPADPFAVPLCQFVPGDSGDSGDPGEPVSESVADPSPLAALDPHERDLLASLPDNPGLLVWPSQVWNDHANQCGYELRECPHTDEVVLPQWWVVCMKTRMPLSADPAEAIAMAMKRINGYRGGRRITAEGAAFARDLTRDALLAGPTPGPVTREWVSQTLATLGGYGTWLHNEGEPVTREHALQARSWERWLDGPDGTTTLSEYSRRNYRIRLDKIAVVLLSSQRRVDAYDPGLGVQPPLVPLTRQQETDLWVWAAGVRPATRRTRVQAVIVTSLGIGARRRDFRFIQGQDVFRDDHGVHVRLPESSTTGNARVPARTVTCSTQWAERLWDLAQALPSPQAYLSSTHLHAGPPDSRTLDGLLRNLINDPTSAPPVDFSSESLRNTWLLRHIEAGTPLPVLMPQAALLSTVTLDRLLTFVTPAAPEAAARFMRIETPGAGEV